MFFFSALAQLRHFLHQDMDMKPFFLFLTFLFIQPQASAQELNYGYFERPLSCPIRFSNLTELRDKIQTLSSSLGTDCSQSNQQALGQLRTSVANLEGIASTFSTFQGSDERAQNLQLARNANQVLGSLNIITSNNSCFYDIRSRGALPVISDVIMSVSQIGLLVPSTTGTLVATGGYIAGSGMRIIGELLKKKYNWNKPEERRAFLQLNCAFFDHRRVMEEAGMFNPESETFRHELLARLKRERLKLLSAQETAKSALEKAEENLDSEFAVLPQTKSSGVSFKLQRLLEELVARLGVRAADYPSKWRQVSYLSKTAPELDEYLKSLSLNTDNQDDVRLLTKNLQTILPDLNPDARAWSSNLDEYEIRYRAPLIAFADRVLEAIRGELRRIEILSSGESEDFGKKVRELRDSINSARTFLWTSNVRLASVQTQIDSYQSSGFNSIFSREDAGKSDNVEILDHYRRLQRSILGREGRGYLRHSLKRIEQLQDALDRQFKLLELATTRPQICAGSEKLRFAWAEYRFKIQEAHDFITTNLDLYRATFRIGREKQRRSLNYVMAQIYSVESYEAGDRPARGTIGEFMAQTMERLEPVERKLREHGCH